MPAPQPAQIEAFAALTKKSIDLRRFTAIGRLTGDPTSARILMALFIGPRNTAQLARIADGKFTDIHRAVCEMVRLGIVQGDGRENFGEYRILPKGRKLLRDMIEAASVGDADPLSDIVPPDRIKPTGKRALSSIDAV